MTINVIQKSPITARNDSFGSKGIHVLWMPFWHYFLNLTKRESTMILSLVIGLLWMMPSVAMPQDISTHDTNFRVDSLHRVLQDAHANDKAHLFYEISKEFYHLANADSALYYAQRWRHVVEVNQDTLNIARAHRSLGMIYLQLASKAQEATGQFAEGIKVAYSMQKRDKKLEMMLLNGLGSAYVRLSLFDDALKIYLYMLSNVEEGNLETEGYSNFVLNIVLNNLGFLYMEIGDWEHATTYLWKSYYQAIATDNMDEAQVVYNNLADSYTELHSYGDALSCYQEVYSRCLRVDCMPSHRFELSRGLGKMYMYKDSLNLSEGELTHALNITSRPLDRVRILNVLGELELRKGSPREALVWLNQTLPLFADEEGEMPSEKVESYQLLAQIHEQLGRYREAYFYSKHREELYKKIFKSDLINNMGRIQTDYEERGNRKIVESQYLTITVKEKMINQLKIFFLGTLMITGVMIVVLIQVLLTNKRLRKSYQTIKQQSTHMNVLSMGLQNVLATRNKQVAEIEHELSRVTHEMAHFMYRISHDFRGPLVSVEGLCNLILTEDLTRDEIMSFVEKIKQEMVKLKEMLQRIQIINHINERQLKMHHFNLQEMIEEIWAEEVKVQNVPKGTFIHYRMDKKLYLSADREILFVVFHNLINNALRFRDFGCKKPFVAVEVVQDGRWLNVKVIDNGVGVPKRLRKSIFQLFVKAATINKFTAGIGLYITQCAVIRMNGEIECVINKGGYTEFSFYIDLTAGQEKRDLKFIGRIL